MHCNIAERDARGLTIVDSFFFDTRNSDFNLFLKIQNSNGNISVLSPL